jgi:polyhydroxyalkanoate synthesis regulator phasin
VISPREAVEQAILVSVGAAALTKDRAETIVGELVARGYLGAEEGRSMVARLVARVRGDGPPAQTGLLGRLESGAQSAFREFGLATDNDITEIRVRLAELERRLVLLEAEQADRTPPPD